MAAKVVSRLMPSSIVEANGERASVNEFARRLGCPVQTILGRLQRGWSTDRAVSEPISSKGGANRGTKLAAEVLTPEEVSSLMAKCNQGVSGVRDRAVIVVGWRAGLRISEVLSLMPSDLNEPNRTILIKHGKGDKQRTVGLDQQGWETIRLWLAARAGLEGITAESPLFCTLKGTPVDARQMRALMERLGKQAGIAKRVHFHGLRHTMASELMSEGVELTLIQKALGHSNAAITSRYLDHVNPAKTIEAMSGRTWGAKPGASPTTVQRGLPEPGWLDQLRTAIGHRLRTLVDSRSSPDEFSAVVILF